MVKMNKNKKFFTNIAAENQRMNLQGPETQRIMYDESKITKCPANDDTNVLFFGATTDDCVRFVIENEISENVYAMNFASDKNPGGGYLNGAQAQEEYNCYVMPELYASISRTKYPLEPGTVLITPGIRIMRDNENYKLLPEDQMLRVGIVSAAAQNLSPQGKDQVITAYDDILTKMTLGNVFCSVKRSDPLTDTLILGAWGCGVFRNDPYMIANEFKDAIKKYGGYYKNIIFAIPDGPNVKEFKQVFGFESDDDQVVNEFEDMSVKKQKESKKSNRKKINSEKHNPIFE